MGGLVQNDYVGNPPALGSPIRATYSHQKSLSTSTNELLRIATHNSTNQSQNGGAVHKSTISPQSAFIDRPSQHRSYSPEPNIRSPGAASDSSKSPSTQGTFTLGDRYGSYSSRTGPVAGVGEFPRETGAENRKQRGSGGTFLSLSTLSGDHRGFSDIWNAVKSGSGSKGGYKPSPSKSSSSRSSQEATVPPGQMNLGFSFPNSLTAGNRATINIQELVQTPSKGSFMDLERNDRNGSTHTRSKTEPSSSRSLFQPRLFTANRDAGVSYMAPLKPPKSKPGTNHHQGSLSISAPFGVSIAAYRPVPTHSTAARVAQTLNSPDLSLDPNNSVLMIAGPSDMQRQVEELENRRIRNSGGSKKSNKNGPSTIPQNPHEPGLRPIVAIREAQEARGTDQPVHWMRTTLPRSLSNELLNSTRWEARNAWTPQQIQDGRGLDDVVIIGRDGRDVTFTAMEPQSPALSGHRVLKEGEARERERQDWAQSLPRRPNPGPSRLRSGSLGSALKKPTPKGVPEEDAEWGNLEKSPRQPDAFYPQIPHDSLPVSRSFGFLHPGSTLRSRSRSGAGSGKASSTPPRAFGSTSTEARSFRNVPREYGSIGRLGNDPFAQGIPRTPSMQAQRLSRNHSSPDLRRLASHDQTQNENTHLEQDTSHPASRHLISGNAIISPLNDKIDKTLHLGIRTPPTNTALSTSTIRQVPVRYGSGEPPILGPIVPFEQSPWSPTRPAHGRGTASPLPEPLPAHTARALAGRLGNSPRRKKTSLEEAVSRARSSAMLSYEEDGLPPPQPSKAYTNQSGYPTGLSLPRSEAEHRQILVAAGILPQISEPPPFLGGHEGRDSDTSLHSTGRLAAPATIRTNLSPLAAVLRSKDSTPDQPSPALTMTSEASPYPRRPIDEMEQYDQELFFSRPETTWSAPLAGPTPSDHQARPVRRSLDMLAKMEANPMAASPTRQSRASKGSSISHLNSTPRTGDHGHKATSSEGLSSAEHATIKVATPVLDFAEYAKQRSSVLSAPFEVRMSGGRTNARRSSEETLARSFERGQEDWTEDDARPPRALLPNAFLESPYVTQTEYGSDVGHGLVNRSDSDNTLAHVRTVSSAFPAHRSPSMDLLTNPHGKGHRPRASVVPEFVHSESSSQLRFGGESTPASSLDEVPQVPRVKMEGSDSPRSSGVSREPGPRIKGSRPMNGMTNREDSTEDGSRYSGWMRDSVQPGALSLAHDFPHPPGMSPSRLSSRAISNPSIRSTAYVQGTMDNVLDQGLLPPHPGFLKPPSMQRLGTDFSGLTGNSYVTAEEGYDTDDSR